MQDNVNHKQHLDQEQDQYSSSILASFSEQLRERGVSERKVKGRVVSPVDAGEDAEKTNEDLPEVVPLTVDGDDQFVPPVLLHRHRLVVHFVDLLGSDDLLQVLLLGLVDIHAHHALPNIDFGPWLEDLAYLELSLDSSCLSLLLEVRVVNVPVTLTPLDLFDLVGVVKLRDDATDGFLFDLRCWFSVLSLIRLFLIGPLAFLVLLGFVL